MKLLHDMELQRTTIGQVLTGINVDDVGENIPSIYARVCEISSLPEILEIIHGRPRHWDYRPRPRLT
jgi:hypothetical protein